MRETERERKGEQEREVRVDCGNFTSELLGFPSQPPERSPLELLHLIVLVTVHLRGFLSHPKTQTRLGWLFQPTQK